jgi:prepilin-type N-terminal cleavage/methylation domain-containing protein
MARFRWFCLAGLPLAVGVGDMLSPATFGKSQRGYTLMEMFVVLGIIAVGSSVAIPITMQMVRASRADSALKLTTTFLQTARNRAVAERRNIVLEFTDDTIVASRMEVPSGLLTVVDTLVLEDGYKFEREQLPDTPGLVLQVGDAIDFSEDEPAMFTSDGSLICAAGDVCNGVMFMVKDNAEDQSRAVQIWGVTGLLRSFRMVGGEWIQ